MDIRRCHGWGWAGLEHELSPQAIWHFGSTVREVDRSGMRLFISRVANELTLYSREWCSWCIDAKDYLSERGYAFTEIDVGRDRDAYKEMTELSEQTYVPTLVAGDEVLANFDTDQLEKFLSEHGIKP